MDIPKLKCPICKHVWVIRSAKEFYRCPKCGRVKKVEEFLK